MKFALRLARQEDRLALRSLIERSARELLASFYTKRQIESALETVLAVDSQLIEDGTFFVAVNGETILGCGGWSRRKTPFGGDHGAYRDSALLAPGTDAARVRAFFVDPGWARRGIGTAILAACEQAALEEGFRTLELVATLGGVPLYERRGFVAVERFDVDLSDGERIPVIRMNKSLSALTEA